jgi:hypothetical protein
MGDTQKRSGLFVRQQRSHWRFPFCAFSSRSTNSTQAMRAISDNEANFFWASLSSFALRSGEILNFTVLFFVSRRELMGLSVHQRFTSCKSFFLSIFAGYQKRGFPELTSGLFWGTNGHREGVLTNEKAK